METWQTKRAFGAAKPAEVMDDETVILSEGSKGLELVKSWLGRNGLSVLRNQLRAIRALYLIISRVN